MFCEVYAGNRTGCLSTMYCAFCNVTKSCKTLLPCKLGHVVDGVQCLGKLGWEYGVNIVACPDNDTKLRVNREVLIGVAGLLIICMFVVLMLLMCKVNPKNTDYRKLDDEIIGEVELVKKDTHKNLRKRKEKKEDEEDEEDEENQPLTEHLNNNKDDIV